MKRSEFLGKRVLIAGSIPQDADIERAKYSHALVKQLAKAVLVKGGGLVLSIGSEPMLSDESAISKIFDWTVLEAVDEYPERLNDAWPVAQGKPTIAVGLATWEKRIPANRKELLRRIISTGKVEMHIVPPELSVGGVLRGEESKYGDLLVTLGGDVGVHHLGQLFQSLRKPVIPLNLSFGTTCRTASEVLSRHLIKKPKEFFSYSPERDAVTAYLKLSMETEMIEEGLFVEIFFELIGHLPLPTAFYVRLLNVKEIEFPLVERFFRNVVDKVVAKMGYQRFEMETDSSEQLFMNIELFEKLHYSSLVVVDLTGVRPNCLLEFGYALGSAKKIILTACEDTKMPWDTQTIHCHFWSKTDLDSNRKKALQVFMRKNVNRNPVIKSLNA